MSVAGQETLELHRELPVVLRDVHRRVALKALQSYGLDFSDWETVLSSDATFKQPEENEELLSYIKFSSEAFRGQILGFENFRLIESFPTITDHKPIPSPQEMRANFRRALEDWNAGSIDYDRLGEKSVAEEAAFIDSPEKLLEVQLWSAQKPEPQTARIFILPDMPPQAVHQADIQYVESTHSDPDSFDGQYWRLEVTSSPSRVLDGVRTDFGDEAIDILSADACRAVIRALLTVEATPFV